MENQKVLLLLIYFIMQTHTLQNFRLDSFPKMSEWTFFQPVWDYTTDKEKNFGIRFDM